MAFKNKEISNPVTGQSIKFLQTSKDTGGVLLEMETVYRANSVKPVEHYHPFQDEDFLMMEGEVTVMINGEQQTLRRGDRLRIPRNVHHSMWNSSGFRAVVNWQVVPAFETEYLLETTFGLALDGKTDSHGRPNLLQVALIMNSFKKVFRLSRPPYFVQRMVFGIAGAIAFVLGYRATYRHLID